MTNAGRKRAPKVDGRFVRREVRKVTGMKDADEDFTLALVMLSSAVVGPSVDRVATFTGLPMASVRQIGSQLRSTGIWRGRRISDSGWFDKNGGIAFCLDVAVAKGWIDKRVPDGAEA